MENTCVAILSGGQSNRFHSSKPLAMFRQEPLIIHMMRLAQEISNSVFVVVSNDKQKQQIQPLVRNTSVVLDPEDHPGCPLTAALAAFTSCEKQFCQLLPVDTPMVRIPLIDRIIELRDSHDAVVPLWPSGYIEPLHSTYKTGSAAQKAEKLLTNQSLSMRGLVDALEDVLFVSVEILKQMDPELHSFKNANTREDLLEMEKL